MTLIQGGVPIWFVNADRQLFPIPAIIYSLNTIFVFSWSLFIAELCCIRYMNKVRMAYGEQNWSILQLGNVWVSVAGLPQGLLHDFELDMPVEKQSDKKWVHSEKK